VADDLIESYLVLQCNNICISLQLFISTCIFASTGKKVVPVSINHDVH
jgi:hypothetical protein